MNQRYRAATRIRLRIPPDGSLAGPVLMLPPGAYINVADSIIEAESVLALAAFFSGIVPCSDFTLEGWSSRNMVNRPGREVYKDGWDEVYRRAKDGVSLRS